MKIKRKDRCAMRDSRISSLALVVMRLTGLSSKLARYPWRSETIVSSMKKNIEALEAAIVDYEEVHAYIESKKGE